MSTDTVSTDTVSTDTVSTDTVSTDTVSTDTVSTDTVSTDTMASGTTGLRCRVYRSSRHAEMYLFVTETQDLAPVPEDLLARFGGPEPALAFALVPGRRLARIDADEVLAALRERGWFLQLPPRPDELAAVVAARNEKLPRG